MHRFIGPRQPISINPNGNPDYTFNPMENLAVEECSPWDYSGVFSSETIEVFSHEKTLQTRSE